MDFVLDDGLELFLNIFKKFSTFSDEVRSKYNETAEDLLSDVKASLEQQRGGGDGSSGFSSSSTSSPSKSGENAEITQTERDFLRTKYKLSVLLENIEDNCCELLLRILTIICTIALDIKKTRLDLVKLGAMRIIAEIKPIIIAKGEERSHQDAERVRAEKERAKKKRIKNRIIIEQGGVPSADDETSSVSSISGYPSPESLNSFKSNAQLISKLEEMVAPQTTLPQVKASGGDKDKKKVKSKVKL